ncbi:receptor-like protein kinase isoform X2 [Trifolium pratense]|uniref:receptor-like protein kinase isoform X2 n=1 Tax=Trifolium pratense TaxID=57577 RepID=UPI001E698177|nr:receptor-like protein kinase isoform X2 [Trifolium pratense]
MTSSSWKASDSNPCSWVGVQCDHTNNLISLNLTSHGIFGQLGSEIGNLYNLQTLVLSGNGFSGKVPLELSNCSLLQYLDLEGNRFSGNIPYSFINLQNLQFMRLSANMLTGEIPDSLFEIPSLKELSLHSNLLSGPIPTSIGNLTQLLRLYLYGNQLSGTIPSSIGNCSKLEDLELSFNRLRGEIPNSIWRIPSLVNILVHNNSLSGDLPTEMTNLKYLKNISLFDNQFSGVIPQSLGINSSIVKLDCMNNKFSGNIPPNLCFGKNLCELNMGINQLQGAIPSDIGRCKTLKRLILDENNFSGPLPYFERNLNLKYMDISKNNISGLIPSSLGNCTSLTYINLSWNKFAGLVPSELGNLVNLVILDLSHNNLQGSLPLRLSNCTKLDRFDVGFNFLNGSLPSSFRTWTEITTLILRENHFTGGIPGFLAELSNLRELQLGGNLFGGKIPRSMGKLHNLFYGLNLSANGLIGDIPSEIRKLGLLQSLDISLNNLSGSIDALEDLVSLIEFNISYNLFNGSVPKFLMKLLYSSPSSFMGNPLLCVSCLSCIKTSYIYPCVDKSTDHKGISNVQIVMIELGSSILISAILVIIIQRHFHTKESDTKDLNQWYYIDRGAGRIGVRYAHESNILGEENPTALPNLVLQATENLSDQYIIGRGAHGIVYKALLGQHVFAVKKFEFTRRREKQLRMMQKEIEVLGMYKHRNLIKYADYWIGADYGLVLYEFIENGSLHDILHEKNPPPPLTWKARFNIAVGIAEGIAYLHNNCVPPIVHRDIKPKNILIDDNMEPIIADFGTALYRKLSEDSYSYSETRKMLSTIVVGTPGYIAPENAYVIVQSRKSDVYSYGIVLLEIITRKRVVVPCLNDESNVTSLVSWARSVWLETGKIEYIADPYLAETFPNSAALTKQVTSMFLLALQCTEKDLRKRPTMKDVIGLYKRDMFKWCDEEENRDVIASDTSLQSYSPNIFPIIPVVSIDHHIHGESSRAAAQRQREVTFTVEAESMDYIDFRLWQDFDQVRYGLCLEDDWSRIPTIYIDGLLVKLMGNGKIMAENVLVVAAMNVPKVTYVWPSLIFLPSVVGPIVTKPFNWFFLLRWGQYMHLRKSLSYQPKSYFINANKINALQDLILEATENLNDRYIIGRKAHYSVYKVILGQQVFALKKFEFGKNKQKQLSIMWNEIEVLGMFKHRNLITYTDYWIGGHYGLVLCKFMENGSLQDILHEKKPSLPIMWSDRFKIAVGIAKGLAHLHYNCMLPLMHGDINPKNIFLDANMEPIIADFGTGLIWDLSKVSYSHSETSQMLSLHVIGTPGYIAPENAYIVGQGRKSDVYSYGVVLLELITRKKVFVFSLNDATTLVSWARSIWLETGKIENIVDPYLANSFPNSAALAKQVTKVFLLALQCTDRDLRNRPTMKDVIDMYNSDLFNWSRGEVEHRDAVAANHNASGQLL